LGHSLDTKNVSAFPVRPSHPKILRPVADVYEKLAPVAIGVAVDLYDLFARESECFEPGIVSARDARAFGSVPPAGLRGRRVGEETMSAKIGGHDGFVIRSAVREECSESPGIAARAARPTEKTILADVYE
jgi:hypothetical protein